MQMHASKVGYVLSHQTGAAFGLPLLVADFTDAKNILRLGLHVFIKSAFGIRAFDVLRPIGPILLHGRLTNQVGVLMPWSSLRFAPSTPYSRLLIQPASCGARQRLLRLLCERNQEFEHTLLWLKSMHCA